MIDLSFEQVGVLIEALENDAFLDNDGDVFDALEARGLVERMRLGDPALTTAGRIAAELLKENAKFKEALKQSNDLVESQVEILSPEAIAYIRGWAKSGNEPRKMGDVPPLGDAVEEHYEYEMQIETELLVLSSAGLTIVAFADALVQANGVAERSQPYDLRDLSTFEPNPDVEEMRSTFKKLMGKA